MALGRDVGLEVVSVVPQEPGTTTLVGMKPV
jgi:hypothetical protein